MPEIIVLYFNKVDYSLKCYVKDLIQMKKILKKISAVVMAFTLLGNGTAITKIFPSQTDTSITAYAICMHDAGVPVYGFWIKCGKENVPNTIYRGKDAPATFSCDKYYRTVSKCCSKCGTVFYSKTEYMWQSDTYNDICFYG